MATLKALALLTLALLAICAFYAIAQLPIALIARLPALLARLCLTLTLAALGLAAIVGRIAHLLQR